MNILIIMIPLSLLILIGAIAAFFWAVNNDQFDDMDSPSMLPMTDKNPGNENVDTSTDVDADKEEKKGEEEEADLPEE
ncbi:MAG: cbb3-type cytochrome oxidase assembly protein CcoS [Alcanivoracaceae bacterium]|nr:cbb3-type cytochrome oxidase assembly protein CcoS [Alcanivoracaceae bacterium]